MDQSRRAEVIRRWALCRCQYARAPMDPCRCDEATLARAEKETLLQINRWDKRLSKEQGNG